MSQGQLTDLPLEDLLKLKVDAVYAASKFVQEVAQAPASVSIITGEEIRSHGYRTLGEILRSVRGFYVSYDRNYTYLGVRGFARSGDYNSRVLVLVNGHRLNDTIFDSALLGTESPLDVALFERVEVIRGPSSSLYGTNAFFAVVNIITRSGHAIGGSEIEGQAGSQLSRAGRVTTGGRTSSGLEGLLSFSAFAADGNNRLYYPEFDTPAENNGVARHVDRDGSMSIFGSATAGDFQLQVGYGSRGKTIPTAAFGTVFNDARTRTVDARGFVEVQLTHRIQERSTVQARAAIDRYDYDGSYAYETGLFRDRARGLWGTTDIALVQRFDRHTLTGGLEYRNNLKQDQSAVDETGVLLDDRRRSQTAAAYVQDEVRLLPRIRVNAGVRLDQYFDTFGGTLNPRIGVITSPFNSTTVKLLYGLAFRAPNPFELYYYVSPRLAPERIATHEVVWEQRLTPVVQLTASAFHNRVTDLITLRSGSESNLDGLYYENGGGASANGAELELQAELPGRIRGRVSFASQSVDDATSGEAATNAPGQLATMVVDAPIRRWGFFAGFNTSYVGERRTVAGAIVGAAFISDLTLTRRSAGPGVGIGVSLHNLFDAAYADPASEEHRQLAIPQDGRTLSVQVTWRF